MPDWSLPHLVERGLIDEEWAAALAPAAATIRRLGDELADEEFLPRADDVLRAFRHPPGDVRVLIAGQDPYPTPGHAIGLSFATARDVRPLPRSLANIYAERQSDLGIPPAPHGDLSAWSAQGVLLLNRVLTVAPGAAASHRRRGWEEVSDLAIRALVERGAPLVAVLWGKDAEGLRPLLGDTPVIASAHPSPLSARRGFFGSRPFSRANALLAQQGAGEIDWRVGGEESGYTAAAPLF